MINFRYSNRLSKFTLDIIFVLLLLFASTILAQDVKCNYCKQKIEGEYTVVEGKTYHPNHFLCANCNKPINGNYYKDGSKYYHRHCYEQTVVPKCDVCLKPLTSKYLKDIYGITYHEYHEKEYPYCDNCNRLISQNTTRGGFTYEDGRNICNLCKKNSVSSDAVVPSLLNKVIKSLRNYGLNFNTGNINIKAVDRKMLKSAAGNSYSASIRGYCWTRITEETFGKRETIKYEHTIFVLNKIPAKYIEATIAHELMHVWINENIDHSLTKQLEEGSCNFIAYLYLKYDYSNLSKDIIKQLKDDPSPIYGDGFRKVSDKFKGRYPVELLNYLKSNDSI